MWRKQVKDWFVYLAVRVFVCLVQAVRIETCHGLARLLAVVACDVLRIRGRVVDEDLQHVFPALNRPQRLRLARRMWEHLLLMVCEVAHAPRKIHRTNWHEHVHIDGTRQLLQYALDFRPLVVVSGHFGNFELGGFITGLLGFPSFTVTRPIDNPYLDRYVNRFRSANGQFMIAKEGSAAQIDSVLAAGQELTLLGDQHAGRKGCWVDFFGRPASCHKAIALFSLANGAPLLVGYTRRRKKPLQFDLGIAGIADPNQPSGETGGVVELTQWYNRKLEQIILSAPEQYWWLHRRWKEQPPRRRRSRSSQQAA